MSERINEAGNIQLRFVDAIVEGKEMLLTRTYSGVKVAATDDACYNTAVALASLQTKPLKHMYRGEKAELIES